MILRRDDDDKAPRPRRSEDSLTTAVGRVTVVVMLALGGGGAGWLAKDRVASAAPLPTVAVDEQARRDLAVLRAEVTGDLRAIRQQQDAMVETLREMRDEARRGRR